MRKQIKRMALNRGTAQHIGDNLVRFVWPCGCKRVEAMEDPGGKPLGHSGVALLVKNWRANGVVLEQCSVHPSWHSKLSQVVRLNMENPP